MPMLVTIWLSRTSLCFRSLREVAAVVGVEDTQVGLPAGLGHLEAEIALALA